MIGVACRERVKTGRCEVNASPDHLFGLGMKYSVERTERCDLVMAHMYFNLAGMQGHQQAIDRRAEVAAEMSAAEIAAAQRAARMWLGLR
jgi:hypothetical protein